VSGGLITGFERAWTPSSVSCPACRCVPPCGWCTTTGHRLQRGLLRQHFFLGLRSNSSLGFKW